MEYNKYHKLLDDMVKLNIANRESIVDLLSLAPPAIIAREHCTIRSNIGRRTGKSEYIRTRAKRGDLIIVSNTRIKKLLFSKMRGTVAVANEVNALRYFKTIFIDEPSLVFNSLPQTRMFKMLAHDSNQTFIMLGY